MRGNVGDRIVVATEHVGEQPREGEVLEVVERGGVVTYRVRWADGHESLFTPSGGAVRFVPGEVATRS
ncbi:MAG: DUF1918 domain-containing protein [Actinobacteria bacterium]|nr:DUF1918 domain-containing protein [Actinomycetota bacterium]